MQLLSVLLAIIASPSAQNIALPGPFIPFTLCMGSMTVEEQVAKSQELGFTGMGLGGASPEDLRRLVAHPDVRAKRFRIASLLWWAKTSEPVNVEWLDATLVEAAKLKMAIWIAIDGPKGDFDAATKTAQVFAERCRAHGVQLVLYPHMGCTFETAEESLILYDRLKKLGYPEVRLSIHLCHELKAGTQGRLDQIIPKVAPLLALSSVSGGDTDARGRGDWETAIKPLGEGTYDASIFLRLLAKSHYRGPIELHTYGLPDPRKDDHLARSMAWWKKHVQAKN